MFCIHQLITLATLDTKPESPNISSANALARFRNGKSERGPHPIPFKRERSNQFHRIFSVKAGMRIVVAESPLEAHAIFWAEGESNVTSLCEQDLRIHAPYGKQKYVTLDLSVQWKNGNETFYEVKPENSLTKHPDGRLLPKHWNLMEAWSKENGRDIQLMTNVWLENHKIRIENWRALLGLVRAFKNNYDPDLETNVLSNITKYPNISTSILLDRIQGHSEHLVTACIASLLHEGRILGSLDEVPFHRFIGLTCNE